MEFMAYSSAQNADFAAPHADFERFQPLPPQASFEHVETSYFGFNIPQERINAEIYHWYHPKLGVSTGGVYIWQGLKPLQLAAEYYDYRSFMPLPENIVDCTQPSGVRIDMLEPNHRFHIQYEDSACATALDLDLTAIMPLAVRARGGHFTQAMRTHGTLRLRGREYPIDGWYTRDRSWGDARSERPLRVPPIAWAVGVFDDRLAFHITSFDAPRHHPTWASEYPNIKDGANHLWGYLWRDGKLLAIRSVDQQTRRGSDGITPSEIRLRLEDSEGVVHDIAGKVEARLPRHAWENMLAYFCLARWEYAGRVGYGDWQDLQYSEHVQKAFTARDE
jgi:hypothetical protein